MGGLPRTLGAAKLSELFNSMYGNVCHTQIQNRNVIFRTRTLSGCSTFIVATENKHIEQLRKTASLSYNYSLTNVIVDLLSPNPLS